MRISNWHHRITGNVKTNLSGIRVSPFFPDNQSLEHSGPHDQSEHHSDPQNQWCNLEHTHTAAANHGEHGGCAGKKATEITEQQAKFKTQGSDGRAAVRLRVSKCNHLFPLHTHNTMVSSTNQLII